MFFGFALESVEIEVETVLKAVVIFHFFFRLFFFEDICIENDLRMLFIVVCIFICINYKKEKQLIKSSKKVSIIFFWALLIELVVNIFLQAEKEGINYFLFIDENRRDKLS